MLRVRNTYAYPNSSFHFEADPESTFHFDADPVASVERIEEVASTPPGWNSQVPKVKVTSSCVKHYFFTFISLHKLFHH